VGAHHGRRVLVAVVAQRISYSDLSRITAAEFRLVLSSEIVGEGFFGVWPEALSRCAVWRRCACRALDATSAGIAVEDDPSVGFSRPPWFSEFDSRAFVGTAHLSLMVSMLASVVNVLPAILSARRLLRSISRRRPDPPTLPSGNAICAAISRRSGVVAVIVSGDGTRFGVFGLCFRGCLMEQPSLSAASASVIRPSRRRAVLVSVTLGPRSCSPQRSPSSFRSPSATAAKCSRPQPGGCAKATYVPSGHKTGWPPYFSTASSIGIPHCSSIAATTSGGATAFGG